MAKCKLDSDEPKLSIVGNIPEANVREGLSKLRNKVAHNHNISMWFRYSLKGFPDYANKVWEWDFKPTGDRSATRPGWSVFAYVPTPRGPEPILARPFLCWDKSQAPRGNEVPTIVAALKKFLSEHVRIEVEEETFRHTVDGPRNIATCQLCWESFESADLEQLEILKATHKLDCPGHPPF